ncbi:MAG: TIGR00289 family protein, partial [Candidatus Brocadiia bacterium]
MKVAALLSGGKDSVYSIFLAQSMGWSVEETITVIPENPESWMFHYPNAEISKVQSRLMNILCRPV